MLLPVQKLQEIRAGTVSLAFRRWKRPTVRAGGTLLTAVGQLRIEAVDKVQEITPDEARLAGYISPGDLEETLADSGELYRIRLSYLGPDPRVALGQQTAEGDDLVTILRRLERLDNRAPDGPWTQAALRIIRDLPEVRAADLSERLGVDKVRFKTDVRKLKAMGLTESLSVGYRLSRRGESVLRALEAR